MQKERYTSFISDIQGAKVSLASNVNVLERYTFNPPQDKLLFSNTYSNIYLQSPKDPENNMDISNVQSGYAHKSSLSNESLSGVTYVRDKFSQQRIMDRLTESCNSILQAKSSAPILQEYW